MRVEIKDNSFLLTVTSERTEVTFQLPYRERDQKVYIEQELAIRSFTVYFTDPIVRKWFISLSNWYAERTGVPIRASYTKRNEVSALQDEFIRLETLETDTTNVPKWVDVLSKSIQSCEQKAINSSLDAMELEEEEMLEDQSWEVTDDDFDENPDWLQEMIKGSDDAD